MIEHLVRQEIRAAEIAAGYAGHYAATADAESKAALAEHAVRCAATVAGLREYLAQLTPRRRAA